jgi:hypothetical protein
MNWWNYVKKNNWISKYNEIRKQNKILMDGITRPSAARGYFSQSVHIYPRFPYNTFYLYDLAFSSDTLTSVHNALRRELFRNGFDLVEAEKEGEEETTSEAETIPKGKNQNEILNFLENINDNQQSLIDVCMEIEDDFSIIDSAFMTFMFEYNFDEEGNEKSRELKQVLRGDPRFMGPILNKYDRPAHDDDDQPLFFCPKHREDILEGINKCPKCGLNAWHAFYFKDYEGKKIYYARWEVVFRSKYRPSLRGGFSPIVSCWQKVRTLLFMDKYIMQLYDGQRPPKSALLFKTSNLDALEETISKAKQKVKDNPHWPMTMGIPDTSNGREFVKFIDLMKGLDELQHVEMRNEFRRQIGSIYGIEPLFQGDMSTSGGLNNEGLQLTVTTRAVEYGQGIYNKYFFPELIKAIGAEGWSLTLNPSEEQDEMAKLTRQNQSLFNGQLALQLGLEAEYDDDTGEVTIKPGKLEEKEPEVGETPFGQPTTPPRPTGSPSIGKGRLYQDYEFNKDLIKAKNRPSFSKLSDTLKKEIDSFIKRFKRKPSETELRKAISQINLKLSKELSESTNKLFKQAYLKEIERVEKELGLNVIFGTVDENALTALNSQDVLSKAYSGISSNITTELNGIIQEAYRDPKGLSVKQITDKISDMAKVADFKAETIARTEMSKVSSAARKVSYSKEQDFDTFLFKWIGPNDNRTTDTSKRIKSRTINGVTWNELIGIVKEESSRDFPEWTVDKDFPISHYNSRHTFVKIPGSTEKSKRTEMQEIVNKETEQEKKDVNEEFNLELKKKEIKIMKEKKELIKKLKNE